MASFFVFSLLFLLFLYGASSAPPGFLHPDSQDDMATREKVRQVFSAVVVKPQKHMFKADPKAKRPRHPKRPSIVDLNKNVSDWMYQGDMLLTLDQAKHIAGVKSKSRVATSDPNFYWSSKTPINYFIDQSIQNDQRKLPLVQQGIKYWQDNTCLNFVNNPSGANALRFYIGSGCWSYVGKQAAWKTQDVSIGNGCESLGTVTHEMAHALGFYHQQSRYDRDNFLWVDFSNIPSSLQYNFVKLAPEKQNNFDIPFDYSSVMQYDAYAFAKNPQLPSMRPTRNYFENAMGQRESPAFSDVMMVNYLYNCSQNCQSKPACQNSGIVNSRSCSQCLCPRQFSGPTCTDLARGSAVNCNGKILTATTSWQAFNATAGDPNSYDPSVKNTDCFWHIKAPQGRKVSLYITNPSQCQDGCHFQSFEINLGNFALGGMVLCCGTSTFTSSGNLVTIRGETTYNQNRFTINYKIV